jgi:hypothetical protein
MNSQRQENESLKAENVAGLDKPLRFLSAREIYLIDRLLSSVGTFGEVRLTVKDGRLRFAASTKSYDALKWEHHELDVEA